jgi:hypothetical protein
VATATSQQPRNSGDQPQELQDILTYVKKAFDAAEKIHKPHAERWDESYGLYRNYRDLKKKMKGRAERDRDGIILGARREWAAELFIPYCFATVETIVPRVISQNPRMLVLPRTEEAKDSARRVQELLDVQQKDISYDLKLQSVARSGLKYGLGVGKTIWRREVRKVRRNVPRRLRGGYQTVETEVVLRNGPDFEPVNIWDFFWEPSASSIETAGYVIHRTWRSQEYVKGKVESGEWFPVDLEAVAGLASSRVYSENIAPKMEAAGMSDYTSDQKLHEVWEYHDRERVYIILDRELVVVADNSPFFHRELPFQIYRPTPQEHEFVGIGEIEPIKHLQYELNTLRSQRRDNATMVMQKAFIYSEGFVDPDDLKIGPGKGIPVRGANIRDVIQPLEFGEVPGSAYQEANEIKEDIERTTGVSDAVAGGAGMGTTGTDTATGIQLVQAAANVRIALKARNLEVEVVREAGRQFMELDRQHILTPQQIRVDDPAVAEGYRFEEVGPQQLLDDIEHPIPDAGSTEPDNPAAKQNSALTLFQALQNNPRVDQGKLASFLLREFDVADAASYMYEEGTVPVDPNVLGEALVAAGFDPNAVLEVLQLALEAATTGEAPEEYPEAPAEEEPGSEDSSSVSDQE